MRPDRYTTIHTHRGFEIRILKSADPTKDELGYVIDHYFFIDRTYSTIREAADDIDRNIHFIKD